MPVCKAGGNHLFWDGDFCGTPEPSLLSSLFRLIFGVNFFLKNRKLHCHVSRKISKTKNTRFIKLCNNVCSKYL